MPSGRHDPRERVALVTGASSGIGQAIALGLAQKGISVCVHYRMNENGAKDTLDHVTREGRSGYLVQADISQAEDIRHMVECCLSHYGRLDILVNNAADPVARADLDEWSVDMLDRVLAINLRSVWLCCQAALKPMKEAGSGRIVNISSIGAVAGGSPWTLPYAAAKGGVETFTRGLARAVGKHGITVNAVAPGSIRTPMQETYAAKDYIATMTAETAVGRCGRPDDVSGVVVYLATEASSFITGQVFRVDGGRKY